MLNQLKEIQNNYRMCENERRSVEHQVTELAQQLEESTKEAERYLAEFRQSEVLRLENEKKKEELKLKAQESIRHWKLKCKKLEHEVEKQMELHNQLMEKNNLVWDFLILSIQSNSLTNTWVFSDLVHFKAFKILCI